MNQVLVSPVFPLVQKAATQLLTGTWWYRHISPHSLHWLPVNFRNVFKFSMYVFKSVHGFPFVLPGSVPETSSARKSSSLTRSAPLGSPHNLLETRFQQAFTVAAARNALPTEIHIFKSILSNGF